MHHAVIAICACFVFCGRYHQDANVEVDPIPLRTLDLADTAAGQQQQADQLRKADLVGGDGELLKRGQQPLQFIAAQVAAPLALAVGRYVPAWVGMLRA